MSDVSYNKADAKVTQEMYKKEYSIQQETLHSPFDIETHKQVFIDYLEVIIDEDGVVHYAVPSHQEWLIEKSLEKLGINREDLYDECPDEYCLDIMTWLTEVTKCVSVWNDRYIGDPNNKQIKTLHMLKENNVYRGNIPYYKFESHIGDLDKARELLLAKDDNIFKPYSYHCGILRNVKQIARITLCGCVNFEINDSMNFIRPTPEQIKNLHDNFCIDVELFDDNI